MLHGLLGTALLVCFFWLAWVGWRDYQKVEAYRLWAQQFDCTKYDIYAVLGQKGDNLTWGKPTPKGPMDLDTFSLVQVEQLGLRVDQQWVNLDALPSQGRTILVEFHLRDRSSPVGIPFTEIPLAAKWTRHLLQHVQSLNRATIN